MKLPNQQSAYIPPEKLTHYLLDPNHRIGGAKARFLMRFGFSPLQPEELERALHNHARANDVEAVEAVEHGTKYRIRGSLESPDTRNPEVLTIWVILDAEDFPRFVTLVPERR